ncbi:MAG: TRAP transporter substrate-binding protein [Gammaproteobacteria bacterium]|nr:TRAP transporter substrate-binding protein [Gammaproteobacteria bacterium]
MKLKATILRTALVFCSVMLAACGGESEPTGVAGVSTQSQQTYEWKLVTTWPKNFPGLGETPERFAELVEEMSNGRMSIRVYGAGEIVPALEVFDAVSAGTAEMGHSAAYYWRGKAPEAQFFGAVPFGLNAEEMESWISFGGGQELWEEVYAPFNLVPMLGGNTGVQMGGWFNKEINSLEDFQGLTMRIPGLGGEVVERIGGVPVNLAAGDIYTSLQTGVIDATEFVGPQNDLALGFYDVADYYYFPGWHEAGSLQEFMLNKEIFEALPVDLQTIIRTAATAVSSTMADQFRVQNSYAFATLVEEHGVDVRQFPDDLTAELYNVSQEVINELGQSSEIAQRILASYRAFEAQIKDYQDISEEAYIRVRAQQR